MIGQIVSHYRIVEKLGEGGMGVVYKALDLRLDRFVALKFLPVQLGADPEKRQRFIHEAKAASALEHPNICPIHEIDETPDGQLFIAMAYLAGETLKARIERGRLSEDEATDLALQVARALAKAHSQGIVHRDVKPANVIVTADGVAVMVDFGLAKLSGGTEITRTGTTLGTAAYMSPEQAQGLSVDHRSDIWALGVVLYEMLAGERPFRGEHLPSIVFSIVNHQPKSLRELRPDLAPELERIVDHALAKDRDARYHSAADLAHDLVEFRSTLSSGNQAGIARRSPLVPALALALALVAAGLGGWLWWRSSRARWAREQALPEIGRLVEQGRYVAAFDLAVRAERYVPSDPQLTRLWPEMSRRISIESDPPGAEVSIQEYASPESPHRPLGRTPVSNARIPLSFFLFDIAKSGFASAQASGPNRPLAAGLRFVLDPEGSVPPGMVRGPAEDFYVILAHFGSIGPLALGQYWIDKYEVTNRQFKEFVDHGGYQRQEYWKYPVIRDGRRLPFEEAMTLFRDATGRPGPSTWEAGVYPEGKDEFPVGGVSWYEAAAYAEFAGKSLPTFYHWHHAASVWAASYIIPASNFGGSGTTRVGERRGITASGAYDMAGNVREWVWNEVGSERFILGGAWNQPSYLFHWAESRPPLDRSAGNGFRCAKYAGPVPANLTSPLRRQFRDYSKEKPVSDEVFRIFRSMYAREPGSLDPRIESTDATSEYWTRQKVTIHPGYGGERMSLYVFLPINAVPPIQSVIVFPGSNTLFARSSQNLNLGQFDFLVKSGRAVVYPVYKGTYERQIGLIPMQQNRDVVGQWVKDLGAVIDYLEIRPDMDRGRIAYTGFSMGARVGLILTALEPRIKVNLFLDGGLPFLSRPPEVDEINFAPRVRIPTLFINGRYDFIFPHEAAQIPMIRLVATPEKDRKVVLLDTGHGAMADRSRTVREALDWLDRYLGAPARSP